MRKDYIGPGGRTRASQFILIAKGERGYPYPIRQAKKQYSH
jgi:hypothetical protein